MSQRIGDEDTDGAERVATTGVLVAAVFGLVASTLGVLWGPQLIGVLTSVRPQGADTSVVSTAGMYLSAVSAGIVVASLSDGLEAVSVGQGDSRPALVANAAAVLVNAILDPLLIFSVGPLDGYGVFGAGVAMVCGFGASFLVLIYYVLSRGDFLISFGRDRLSFDAFRRVFYVGAPVSSQSAMSYVAQLVVAIVMFRIGGTAGLAAYAVGSRALSVASQPSHGYQQALQTIVAQNLGANQIDRARRSVRLGLALSVVAMAALAVTQWVFAGAIVRTLAPSMVGQAFDIARYGVQTLALGYPAIAIHYVIEAAFGGASMTDLQFKFGIVKNWILFLPGVLALGPVSVFLAQMLANVGVAVVISGLTS